MTHARFRQCIERLGLSQLACARLFHISDRQVRRFADDSDYEIPLAIAMALEFMVRYRINPARAYKLATGKDFEG